MGCLALREGESTWLTGVKLGRLCPARSAHPVAAGEASAPFLEAWRGGGGGALLNMLVGPRVTRDGTAVHSYSEAACVGKMHMLWC